MKAALCYVKYLISGKLQERQPLQHLLFKQSKNKKSCFNVLCKVLNSALKIHRQKHFFIAKTTVRKLKNIAPSLSLNDVMADTNPDM